MKTKTILLAAVGLLAVPLAASALVMSNPPNERERNTGAEKFCKQRIGMGCAFEPELWIAETDATVNPQFTSYGECVDIVSAWTRDELECRRAILFSGYGGKKISSIDLGAPRQTRYGSRLCSASAGTPGLVFPELGGLVFCEEFDPVATP